MSIFPMSKAPERARQAERDMMNRRWFIAVQDAFQMWSAELITRLIRRGTLNPMSAHMGFWVDRLATKRAWRDANE